jgi:hypothetical protein
MNPEFYTPENAMKLDAGLDEDLEGQVRSEIRQCKADRVGKAIETEAELEELFEVNRRVYAKVLKRPEYSHLQFNDPVTLSIAKRLRALDPALPKTNPQAFCEKVAEVVTGYRGLGPVQRQRGQQRRANAIYNHREMIKGGGIQRKKAEDAQKFAEKEKGLMGR